MFKVLTALPVALLLATSSASGNGIEGVGTSQDFGGIRTFLRAPYVSDIKDLNADIAVIGVPFDEGTTGKPGTRYGPRDIREASLVYSWARKKGYFYIDTKRKVLEGISWADLGDVNVVPTLPAMTAENITKAVTAIVKRDAFPVVLGGDHSISFPVVRALKGSPLTLVHIDAHADNALSSKDMFDHASWVDKASHLPHVKKVIQIGMRGIINSETNLRNAKKMGATVVTTERIHREGVAAAIASIPKSERIYVSIDIDALDPSIAPGTGSAEVGGLFFQEVSQILMGIPSRGRVVGMDVVEVNSLYDETGRTAQTAARLILDLTGAALP